MVVGHGHSGRAPLPPTREHGRSWKEMVMGADTRLIPLGRLGKITAGPSGSLLERLHQGSDGVPVISPPDLTESHTIATRRLRRLPAEDARRLSRFALCAGDILIVRQGTLGRLALIEMAHAGWLYNSSCLRLRPSTDVVLPEYLVSYLALPWVRDKLAGRAQAGTVPALNSAIVGEFPVTVPSLESQRAVVDTLGDVDEQVGIHRAMADRLEAMKPAIFDELLSGSRTP